MHVLITCTDRRQDPFRYLLPESDQQLTFVGGAYHLNQSFHQFLSAIQTLQEVTGRKVTQVSLVNHLHCMRAQYILGRPADITDHSSVLKQVGDYIRLRYPNVTVDKFLLDEDRATLIEMNGQPLRRSLRPPAIV